MSLGATDKQRSLFLKGFKLSKQGQYEDPTYLGFKIVIDFGTLPINPEDGLPPSPLFRDTNYEIGAGNDFFASNPFGQPQYEFRTQRAVSYYSASRYLEEREFDFPYGKKRADMLRQFRITFNDLLTNSPWFIQSIGGLDDLMKVPRGGYQTQTEASSTFSSQRTAGKTLTFNTLESMNLRVTALADLYNQATFDYDYMRELVPRNLRKFTMYIFVSEIRNFFKTSRLIGSSAALTAIDDLSSLLGSGNNPGSSIAAATNVADQQNGNFSNGSSSSINPASSFNSFVGNIFNQAGLDNDFSLLKNQQDQSGIKPMLVFECKNCEFDFTESTPIQSELYAGTASGSATPESQKFKIHVGRVRMRNQYPNIRLDGKPLILGDSWDAARSSVQANPADNSNDILSLGGELLTNFVSNSLNDLINEGVANFAKNLQGLDKAVLGNAYSFNPSELLSNLSFNTAQDFLSQLGGANIGITKTELPNPQSMGLGGPPNRVYNAPSGDAYPTSPGGDLGLPQRIYNAPSGDAYPTSPGGDLGLPNRIYNAPSGDAYPTSPGPDLGAPGRVYPAPSGDEYPTSPGPDLGVPNRIYPAPGGDEYPTSPGPDLGAPDRVYPPTTGDVYPTSPGPDLGAPDRVYPPTTGDVYPTSPGPDLGVPNRIYPAPGGDEYPTSPGPDLGTPARIYPDPSGDEYSGVPGNDLGAPGRIYPDPSGDEYSGVPGNDLGLPNRAYGGVNENVYPNQGVVSNSGQLINTNNNFQQPPGSIYSAPPINTNTISRGDLDKVYPSTSGDFAIEKPKNLGNLKPNTKYNISTDGLNSDKNDFV
jgi:hypothetical protein